MPTLTVKDLSGREKSIPAKVGDTLMETIRDNGFDDLLAICGGACSCATCHVYIDDVAAFLALPPLSEDEDALLDGAEHRRPTSRLSCQIKVVDALESLRVTVAPVG